MTYQDALIFISLAVAIGALLYIYRNPQKNHKTLIMGAIGLELLGIALSIMWAVQVQSASILSLFFVGGWVAIVAIRASMLDGMIKSFKQKKYGRFTLSTSVLLIAYVSLIATGLFDAVNNGGDAANQRLNESKPALALDNEIKITRSKLANLATFADASKAHAETQAANAATAANAAKIQSIHEKLATLTMPDFPRRFERFMNPDCTPKTNRNGLHYRTKAKQLCGEWQRITADYEKQKRVLNAQLPRGEINGLGTSYADKNSEYNGLQNHLIALEKQRAELSINGNGTQSVWRPEDKMIADFFHISPELANRLKWLFLVIMFDILAAKTRVFVSIDSNQDSQDEAEKRKLKSLINNGFSVSQAIAALGLQSHGIPAAQTAPQLKEGGHILTDGLIHAHANEAVLNQGATSELGHEKIDTLNAKHRQGVPVPVQKEKTERWKGGVFQCETCGTNYTAKSKIHRNCSKCSKSNKVKYAKRHAK